MSTQAGDGSATKKKRFRFKNLRRIFGNKKKGKKGGVEEEEMSKSVSNVYSASTSTDSTTSVGDALTTVALALVTSAPVSKS